MKFCIHLNRRVFVMISYLCEYTPNLRRFLILTLNSKAMVPVLILLFVALWFILQGDLFHLSLILCHFVLLFFSPFSIAITSLGKRELILVLFILHTLVRFVLVWICRFPLPTGAWKGLRLVIVALPGLFSYLFFFTESLNIFLNVDDF